MKKQLLSAVLVAGTIGMAGVNAYAVEYQDATNATTEGKITILENEDSTDPVIPDPEDPGEEVEPEGPVNPNTGKLRINYISDFDFGSIKNISSQIVQQAKLVGITDVDNNVGSRVPFIATEDRRGSDRQGWELRVSQPSPMMDASKHELKGATITLSGMRYVNTSEATPVVNQNDVVINSQEQAIVSANALQGAGAWSVALGQQVEDGTTNGVKLTIPENTIKNDTTYSTSLVWELVADPTV